MNEKSVATARRTVLCVDDDLDFLKSLEFFLPDEIGRGVSGTQHHFLFINDPREALNILRELKEGGEFVAMILTDEKMPAMTGTALLAEASKISPQTVRVLLTGHAGLDSAVRAINERLLDKYLTKPIENEHDFTVTIQHLLDRFQMQVVIEEQGRAIQGKVRELSEANALLRTHIETLERTERALEKSEDQLRQSLKMEALGRLAGGVAHDFNNILTAMMIRGEMAARLLPEGNVVRGYVEDIRKSAEKAADLTRQLLTFSRKQVLDPKLLDLNASVDGIEGMLRRLIGEDIQFTTAKCPKPCVVRGDPGQIDQVIMNLAVNARDAMPGGGKLTIETAMLTLDASYTQCHSEVQSGDYVLLAVSDTGCGMDEAVRDRIFEPFFTTKEKERGTGLGLATVYGVVKQNGGHIDVYSEPGLGSCFKVFFPMVAGDDLVTETCSEAAPATLRGSEVVLLVEDERDVRELARTILGDAGYRVLDAANGEEALQIRARLEGPIDLMISDVVMPIMNGPDVYERISPLSPGMKVLYMSGYTDNAIVQNGSLGRGTAFIQKPFTPDALIRQVRATLDAKAVREG